MKLFFLLPVLAIGLALQGSAQQTQTSVRSGKWGDPTDATRHSAVRDSIRKNIPDLFPELRAKLGPKQEANHSLTAAKTTGPLSRLIAYYFAEYDSTAGQFVPVDTMRYQWSGNRKTDPTVDEYWYQTEDFDSAHVVAYTGGNFLPDTRTGQTFNAAGKKLTEVTGEFNPGSNTWVNQDDETIVYDATGLLPVTRILRAWDAGTNAFVNTYLDSFTYDGAGRLSVNTSYNWSSTSNSWVGFARNYYTYDAGGNFATILLQYYHTGTSVWRNYARQDLSHDAAGNPLTDSSKLWNTTQSVWVNDDKNIYTYNASGGVLSHEYSTWYTSSASWVPLFLTLTSYTGGFPSTRLSQTYNTSTSSWRNSSRVSYVRDASGKELLTTIEDWDVPSASWRNESKYAYSYNASGFVTERLRQEWSVASSLWVNDGREQRFYNANDEFINGTYLEWNTTTSAWGGRDGDELYRFWYETASGVGALIQAPAGTVNVYPVPADKTLNLDVQWKEAQSARVLLYDAAGRRVGNWSMDAGVRSSLSIPVQTLVNGTYFLEIIGEKGRISRTVQVYK